MTPEQIDRVFGRGRLKMVTGEHVEVFREAVASGERRRYTKRFLDTREGDFGQWTEREWRILARLIGHGITCVPEVVQFDRGRIGGMRIVQTYDAGVTVDQWATLLPVIRDDRVYRHVFEDCAHWWALAHHCLRALDEIHRLELVHLDVKGDNVCIPYAPANFDPGAPDPELRPVFAQFALIDFAFALVSRESLTTPLPIGWQKEYDYQSPRLLAALERGREGDLQATRELDWRCDMYSLAAMLKRYLPDAGLEPGSARAPGWSAERYDAAKGLILRIREAHDTDPPLPRPHAALIEATGARLAEPELARSLERGWSLARELNVSAAHASPLTPVTQVAPVTRIVTPIQVTRSGRTAVTVIAGAVPPSAVPSVADAPPPAPPIAGARRARTIGVAALAAVALLAVGAALRYSGSPVSPEQALDALLAPVRSLTESAGDAAADPGYRAPAVAADEHSAGAFADASSPPALPPPAPPAPASLPAAAAPASLPAAAAPARERATAHPPFSYRAGSAPSAKAPKASGRSGSTVPEARSEPNPVVVANSRPRAPWASLQPPAWVRSRAHSPGNPPGFKAPQPETSVAAAEAPATREPANETIPPPTAPAARLAADEASAPPVPAHEATAQPSIAPAAAAPAASQERAGAPPAALGQSWFAARNAAPVEDRSVNLAQAPAPSSGALVDPRPDDAAAQARRMLADAVPRAARRGELEVSRVLLIAASAYRPAQDKSLADAARLARIRDENALPVRTAAPAEARRLHGEAHVALATRHDVRRALDLELLAFAADPRDPEIAGALAALYLKASPSRPELARQVALVALTARSPQYSTTRLEDWQTFAVASALSGHETDARNALFVTLALSANVERTCLSGWNALADYGERLRKPVEALLYRVYMRGHSVDSPWCAWPPDWSAPPRLAGELH